MVHTLTITLDDRTFAKLESLARYRRETPEGIAAGAVETQLKDSLLTLAGSLDSGLPDLALRHDDYLADAGTTEPMAVQDRDG